MAVLWALWLAQAGGTVLRVEALGPRSLDVICVLFSPPSWPCPLGRLEDCGTCRVGVEWDVPLFRSAGRSHSWPQTESPTAHTNLGVGGGGCVCVCHCLCV